MSFARIKQVSQRLSVRLAFSFSLLFALSAATSFGTFYVLLTQHLRQNDRSIIEAKWREYSEVFRAGGVKGLQAALESDQMKEGDVPLLVQVLDGAGGSLFLKVPQESSAFRQEIEVRLRLAAEKDGWAEVRSPHEEDKIEFYTARPIGQAVRLRVGKSSDPRDDLLEKLTQVFSVICAFLVVIGAALGFFFSSRALFPLRNLVATMKAVRRGSLSSRVPGSPTKDELEELTTIFNQMLDRVEGLVTGMRETLDNIAHDLRTPLARIRAIAEIRLKEPPGAEDRAALEDCAESADEVASILSSLLELAEAESGTMKLKRERVPISALIRPVIELYEMVAEDKSVLVCFEARIDPQVHVDPARVKQALGNLLDNAIKYSPAGSEVAFSAVEDPGSVTITIRDRGQGIHADDLPRIWDRLFRADRSRSQKGLGIGLSIVRAVVRAHGGEASVESRPGEGSVFSIRLPK